MAASPSVPADDQLAPAAAAPRRRPVLAALLVLLAAVLGLAAVEGFSSLWLLAKDVRAIRPAPENFRQATYDSLVGWVGIPNLHIRNNYGSGLALTTNAEGMRVHRPVSPALGPGEHRAICSGDSFTFGSGVADDETFCAYLEGEIPGLRTLNMSQRGFGIDQAYLWYKRDAVRYPHQLHLFAFIWNDFERMTFKSFYGYPKPILALNDGHLVTSNVPVPAWKGPSRWSEATNLLNDLRLMQLVQRRIDQSDSAKLARVDARVWTVAESVFTDLSRLNASRGSKLVLVYLPAPPDLDAGPYDGRRIRLAAFSKVSGIPLIDLTPEIRAIPRDSLDWLFITPNALPVAGSSGHYTAAGHRWVAKRLAEHLRAMPAVAAAIGATAAARAK